MDLYGQLYSYVDGALCDNQTKCTIKYESDQQEVVTLVKGFAGITPGPLKLVVGYSGSVPTNDSFAQKIFKALLNAAELPVRVMDVAGRKIETTGFVRPGPGMSSGVGETTTLDFELVCQPAMLE